MSKRLILAGSAIFWVVMMALLWRTEFGSARPVGARVPVSLVFNKILTAPDSSTLEIRHGTNRLGYCRWRPDVGQELATGARMDAEADPLEGMVRHLSYYTLDVDGSVSLPDLGRARFVFDVTLNTNRVWQKFSLRVTIRPDVYEIAANVKEQTLHVRVDAGADQIDRKIPFSDLKDPRKILLEFGGPALPLMLGMIGEPAATNTASTNLFSSVGMRWEAHNDSLPFGRNHVRVYRLKGSLLGRYEATFYVSLVGEILRVELPNKVVLVNETISALNRSQ